ncbi:MAG: 30S ribosomal protein S15 [Planctomycetota bacterium]|nr:MAG: 30S ribosomal protein S15 [Planctomycetota bacterium]
MITAEKRKELIQTYRTHEGDTGSAQVQIAILTERINAINAHMGQNKKDFSTKRGLLKLVGRRNRLLRYLRRTDEDGYKKLIQSLGLRK